jgi:hypothetical protein
MRRMHKYPRFVNLSEVPRLLVRESLPNHSTPRQRFNHINAMCQSIAPLVGHSVRSYEMAAEALNN